MIVLTIKEISKGQYTAHVDGRHICTTGEPFFAAARVLLKEGGDSAERYVMRREGRNQDDLVSTLGAAAGLDVAYPGGKPTFVKYHAR